MGKSIFMHCKFCNYKTLKWRKTTGGKTKHGMLRLMGHVRDEHENKIVEMKPTYDCDSPPWGVDI